MKSMTGYGRGTVEESQLVYTVEIKSVNNRYLDLNVRLPRQISGLEDNVRKYIATKIARGKLDIYINQEKYNQEDILVNIDESIADEYYRALKKLKDKFEFKEEISLELLLKYPDIISVQKKEEDLSMSWNVLVKALDEALDMLIEMRSKEGIKLGMDMEDRCNQIYKLVLNIEERAPIVVEEYRSKLIERVSEYLNDIDIDQAKLINEVAFYADKVNITEEIVRLKSHIEQFKNSILTNQPVGRKLDFLIQEMNREINTIGSKAGDLHITNLVVEIKSELEKIREQIQNIE